MLFRSIRWGTYDGQQTLCGTLRTIADEALRAGLRAPAVIIVGEVVRLRERLNWFERSLQSTGDAQFDIVSQPA